MKQSTRLSTELLDDLIQNCVFIHNDWNPNLGEKDWDQYDTNPFLLGSHTCVIGTLSGFGDYYLDYLEELGLLPENILVPRKFGPHLISNLLDDKKTTDLLVQIILNRKLDISLFYSESTPEIKLLASKLSTSKHTPKLIPAIDAFVNLNDRRIVWKLLHSINVPMPIGEICESQNDLRTFLRHCIKRGFKGCVIKYGHRDNFCILSEADLEQVILKIEYPVLSEAIHDYVASPVVQLIRWKSESSAMFVLDQRIRGFQHLGNEYPSRLTSQEKETLIQITKEIMSLFENYEGILGVDFIKTEDGKLLAVDVNPRFNSSTYPFYFAQRQNRLNKLASAGYGVLNGKGQLNLSSILKQISLIKFDNNKSFGVLPFNPVINQSTLKLEKWSYIAVGRSKKERVWLENMLMNSIN